MKKGHLYDLDGDLLKFIGYRKNRSHPHWPTVTGRPKSWALFEILATNQFMLDKDFIVINIKGSHYFRDIASIYAIIKSKPVEDIVLYVNRKKKLETFINLLKGARQ
jgi:hypothetical protein